MRGRKCQNSDHTQNLGLPQVWNGIERIGSALDLSTRAFWPVVSAVDTLITKKKKRKKCSYLMGNRDPDSDNLCEPFRTYQGALMELLATLMLS